MSDVVTLSNGDQYELPGFGALNPDQQAQRVAQMERQVRVQTGAQNMKEREDALRPGEPGGVWSGITEGVDEFTRNATFGLGDYAGALGSYANFTGDDAFEGLSFLERRDALRQMQDMQAEENLPGWVDNTMSALGAVSGPAAATKTILGFPAAVEAGAVTGALEGVGHGENTDLVGVLADAAAGAGAGGLVGGTADVVLDKVVGGLTRKMLREPGGNGLPSSAEAFDVQTRLGITPSVGSIGNKTARTLENALAENPISAGLSEGTRGVVPFGRSSIGNQMDQQGQLADALSSNVTGPMRPPGASVPVNDAELAGELRDVARTAKTRYGDEMSGMEGRFDTVVPPKTPVNITGTRGVPSRILAGGESANIARGAQEEIDTILNNPRFPVDAAKEAQLRGTLGTQEGQLAQIDQQIANLRQTRPDDPQIGKLTAARGRLEKSREKTLALIDQNQGPTFRALRQDRGAIGKQAGQGLAGRDSDFLYKAITRDLETAAAKKGGPNARQAFKDMTKREREIFMSQRLIEPLTTAEGASRNVPFIKRALLSGNDAELKAVVSKLTPEEKAGLNANLLESLGRNGAQDPFVPKTFADNWNRMSPAAKTEIFGSDPEKLALVDAIAKTAESFHARGMASNRSNSASAAGVMAFLGAAVASPDKVLPFLVTGAGIDRVVASEALAKAVAGKPTQLGQLVRRSVFALPSSPQASELLFGEGQN